MGTNARTPVGERCPSSARALLLGLLTQDFPAVRATLAPDAHLRALLPGGLREWRGADDVAGRFERWFGHTERFAAVASDVGEVGDRVRLRWRLRLEAERLGRGCFVVEQVAYCDASEQEIAHLDLLCTGYLAEASDG